MQSDMPEVIYISVNPKVTHYTVDDPNNERFPYARIPDGVKVDDAVVVSRARRDKSDQNAHRDAVKHNETINKLHEAKATIAALEAKLADAEALSKAVQVWDALDRQRQKLAERNQVPSREFAKQLDDARREMVRLAAGIETINYQPIDSGSISKP